MPTALVIGHRGQDGTYLGQFLRKQGYFVTGVSRQFATAEGAGSFNSLDVTDSAGVVRLLAETRPDEVYYLAAFHRSSEDAPMEPHDLISHNFAVNSLGLNNTLGAIACESPDSRLFYASSSRVFGDPDTPQQNEQTPLRPTCAYGISKVAGMEICRYYRSSKNVFASSGILYNHESSLRPGRFVSKKIVRSAVRISRGIKEKLVVGDLNARVDWGYAPDYVRAMWNILNSNAPTDFVIGSGILHSVREFVEAAFSAVGLTWPEHVVQNDALLSGKPTKGVLCADSSKLRSMTGWKPEVDFHQMVRIMVDDENQSFERSIAG